MVEATEDIAAGESTAMLRGADIIAEYLVQEEVPYAFGLCGHGIIGFMDALLDRADRIKTISVHHEQVAGFMADAYFRVAHRPVVTFTSCGPGSANLVVALATAMMDSSAFLAITGNVPTNQFNRGPFQETGRFFQGDFPSVVRPYVKRSFQPSRVEMLPLALRQAFHLMQSARSGPVHLDVPLNVFGESAAVAIPNPREWRLGITSRAQGDAEAVDRVVAALLSAERPLILAGHGVILSEAAPELHALAERLRIPVVNTPNGKGLLGKLHPLALGDAGRNGTYPANRAAAAADVLLAVGCRFDDRLSSSWIPGYSFAIPPTRLLQIDIDPNELGRNYPVEVGVLGDAKAVLQQLLDRTQEYHIDHAPRWRDWLESIMQWQAEWEADKAVRFALTGDHLRPEQVLRALDEALPPESVLIVDVGSHHNWVVQYWKASWPGQVLQSWGFAAMGFAVGGVLGAKLAAPQRPCVALCGDGGFLMTNNAVATAVEYGIPVVWVIWNNYGYVSIRDLQVATWPGREHATSFRQLPGGDLYTPDYAAMARSMGARGVRIEHFRDLAPAIRDMLAVGEPAVIDVHVDRDVHQPSTGTWQLPPYPYPQPSYQRGERS